MKREKRNGIDIGEKKLRSGGWQMEREGEEKNENGGGMEWQKRKGVRKEERSGSEVGSRERRI